MKIGNILTLSLGLMSAQIFANDTVILNQDRLSVADRNVLIERTEITPDKVKIEVPIVFPRRYCTGYSSYTRDVPCPDYSGGSSSGGGSNSGGSSSGSSGGGSHRPPSSGGSTGGHSGGAHRPPSGGGGRPPHFVSTNKCTETYSSCDGYATRYVTEDRTLTLKFKKDAEEYKGTEIYKLVGSAISENTVDFELIAINDLAKSHKLKKHGRKHFVVK